MNGQATQTRPVAGLTPHYYNERIYGDRADEDLVMSVRQHGVLTPLLITAADVVISGHRRLDAAKRAGLATVPVAVFGSTDPLDILEALLESNRQRAKTDEQIGREYRQSLLITTERAKQRQRDAGGAHFAETEGAVWVNSPTPELSEKQSTPAQPKAKRKRDAARAGDEAAGRIGVKRQKAERAAKVVDAIDDL